MKELYSNGFASSIAQAIEEMKAEQGDGFSLDRINLAELERRSGVSRGKLRRLKQNGFQDLPRRSKGRKHAAAKPSGYTGIIDSLLRQGIKNSSVIRDRLRQAGFDGGATIVKEYIASHKHLIPAKRQQIAPQGNRGRRYTVEQFEQVMAFGSDDAMQKKWEAFCRKIDTKADDFSTVLRTIQVFLTEPYKAAVENTGFHLMWLVRKQIWE